MTWFWLGGSTRGEIADDSKELLRQLRIVTNRPETDRDLTDAKGYFFLTRAQEQLTYRLATHIPDILKGAPVKLTTKDNGATYEFPVDPLGHVDIYPAPYAEPLIEAPYWAGYGDYTREGPRVIRMSQGIARTFVDGPWARYVPKPGAIDDVKNPTLVPNDVRRVLPWLAAGMWAQSPGALADPQQFFAEVERQLWGDPQSPGDLGIIGAYKTGHFSSGITQAPNMGLWWRSADLGRIG